MTGFSDFTYAQVRMQSRYGGRADSSVWSRLHNIHDLASYLQAAQQTPLRPWVLGISANHSSHDIELALRQKYRQHVSEVAGWLPASWRYSLLWVKRLADLPVLQYLLAGGQTLGWMKSDPDLSNFTADDPALRSQALRESGCADLVEAWQRGDSMLSGWLSHWKGARPKAKAFERGLHNIEKLLHQQQLMQARKKDVVLPSDYEAMADQLRVIFRRYSFQPAAACAYLAIIAIDVHHIRNNLMQRLYFSDTTDLAASLPV